MLFTESFQELVDTRYGCFSTRVQIKYKEDEKRHSDFPSKEAFQSVIDMTATFIDGAI